MQRVAALAGRPLRIALLTSSRFWRGSSSVFAALARGLADRGHNTTALAAYEPVATGFATQGVSVQTLPVAHTSLTAARALRRTLGELCADIILVDMARDIRHAAAASLGRSLAVVYSISTREPPRDLSTRIAFGRVRVTVFLTEEHARSTLAAAPFLRRAQHRVIHNGVDCRLFHPDEAAGRAFRERYDLPIGPLLVGVGALAPEKPWDLLLAAAALVAPPAPPLLLCGSGALERALRAQARRLGVNATFLGQVEPLALVGAYNAATCVVHTRPDETFGLALAEAMACGRPVLAWASGGPVEVVGDAGVLAAPEDPRGFAAQLERLLADPGRRAGLGAAARRRAVERYSVGRMVRDRKSTRLNSSHVATSYAVFCLKKKKKGGDSA